MSTAYKPPSKREKNPIITSLSPENFPEFVATSHKASELNFKLQIEKAEAQRLAAAEAQNYDPSKVKTLTHEQLEKEGWAILRFERTKEWLDRWNSVVFPEKKVELDD
jgi:Fe-S cluster assembly scaffold protein SufB